MTQLRQLDASQLESTLRERVTALIEKAFKDSGYDVLRFKDPGPMRRVVPSLGLEWDEACALPGWKEIPAFIVHQPKRGFRFVGVLIGEITSPILDLLSYTVAWPEAAFLVISATHDEGRAGVHLLHPPHTMDTLWEPWNQNATMPITAEVSTQLIADLSSLKIGATSLLTSFPGTIVL